MDAVFASNDQMALGVLHAAHVLGRRVPEDLSVVGVDNLAEGSHFWPPLDDRPSAPARCRRAGGRRRRRRHPPARSRAAARPGSRSPGRPCWSRSSSCARAAGRWPSRQRMMGISCSTCATTACASEHAGASMDARAAIDARAATSSHSRPMSVWYLELDDEITDAVARLRAAKDDRVVFVVPPGSRIGTGRINFRLLAREAETRGLGIALVSGDAQVRALAASAGLPVFATVSESEAARERRASSPAHDIGATGGPPPIARRRPRQHRAAGPAPRAAAAAPCRTHAAVTAAPMRRQPSAATRAAPGGDRGRRPGARRARRWRRALYGAYVTIPRATITLTSRRTRCAPVALDARGAGGPADRPGHGRRRLARGCQCP